MLLMTFVMTAGAQSADTRHAVAVLQHLGDIPSVADGNITIPVNIRNNGTDRIENLTVTVSLNGTEKQYTIVPQTESMAQLTIPAPQTSGTYQLTLTVDKVNGIKNQSTINTTEGRVINLTRKVDRKVVFEEFTGFGCGWCPRGLVALEEARQMYGRDIVLISAHYDDPISCRDYNIMKQNQLPSAHLDRKLKSIDPYFGTSGGGKVFAINDDIQQRFSVAPVAEVNVTALIEGDKLTATSDVKFLFTGSGHYAMAFVVTEDGMHNEKWTQLNNYWQVDDMGFIEEQDPLFERWIKGESKLKGYVYDDVVLAAQGVKEGIDNSIPESFVEEESITYQTEFDLSKLKKMQNRKNLNVCAFLYDRDKKEIVNANYMSFEHETAIEGIEADDEDITEVARYTADGLKITSPRHGINIVKYSDGTVRKVIIK